MNHLKKAVVLIQGLIEWEEDVLKGNWVEIDGPAGIEWVNAADVDLKEVEEYRSYIAQLKALVGKGSVVLDSAGLGLVTENKTATSIEIRKGWWGARLSAPGYRYRTEWAVFKTEEEAWAHINKLESDEGVEEYEPQPPGAEGVKDKNYYRRHLPGMDFSGQDLSGANFQGADLYKANFLGANLSKVNFRNATVTSANCQGANFQKADCQGANFGDSLLQGANFLGADLTDTFFKDAIYDSATQWPAGFDPKKAILTGRG